MSIAGPILIARLQLTIPELNIVWHQNAGTSSGDPTIGFFKTDYIIADIAILVNGICQGSMAITLPTSISV